MNQTSLEKLEALLLPVSDERPAGEDLSYSYFFETISEARRADDPSLSQGQWEAPLKVADWSKVRLLCEAGLRERSKDLQLAGWYTEAMTRQEGFAGAALGLRLTGELLQRFRETLHPVDPDERTGKLEWLNSQLAVTLRQVPLTRLEQGGYNRFQWEESREVENLRRRVRGEDAYNAAIKEGKLSADVFNKSVRESGIDWYRALLDNLAAAQAAHEEFVRVIEECFEENAPSFADLREALNACQDVAQKLYELCGGRPDPAISAVSSLVDAPAESQGSPGSMPRPVVSAIGFVTNRAEAIRQLSEVARYFRESEPHSPVALLAERAAIWAEMPLETWLKAVIKDEPTLKELRELLGFSPD